MCDFSFASMPQLPGVSAEGVGFLDSFGTWKLHRIVIIKQNEAGSFCYGHLTAACHEADDVRTT